MLKSYLQCMVVHNKWTTTACCFGVWMVSSRISKSSHFEVHFWCYTNLMILQATLSSETEKTQSAASLDPSLLHR